MFDAMNQAVSAALCDKTATWGALAIQVALTVEPAYEEDTYRVAGELVTAGCLADGIDAMKRGDTLTIDAVQYSVLHVHRDGAGWADIALEKA